MMSKKIPITEQVQRFYNERPYPPPVKDLDRYHERWQDEDRRRADFHLYWPHRTYQEKLTILVAGCGTSQAARYALRNPAAKVVGVDLSPTSIQHTQELKRKYKLKNLEVSQLALEHVDELGTLFDKIICTGVLHHLPDPDVGLRALRDALEPKGALHLMVYATYGRIGVTMLQEYARLSGVGNKDDEITEFANTLMELPQDHPIARLLSESPDFRTKAGLADALLNPLERSYTVPQLFEWISGAGMRFGRWVRQASYLPQCSPFAETPHSSRLMELPQPKQYAALELLRGTMLRHSLIAYRDDTTGNQTIRFDRDSWLEFIPFHQPETISVEERLPQGAAAVLINQSHTDPDIFLPINVMEKQIYESINGRRSIEKICKKFSSDKKFIRSFFERLWWYDQVVFDASRLLK